MTRARDKASAVVASFASTGIDDNADATAITIDSSENLLVGQSSTTVPGAGNTTAGTSLRGTDGVFISRTTSDTSASALQVNKTTGAGNIINVASGGTTVGTIGTRGGDLTIGTGNCGLIFNDGTEIVIPANTTTNDVSDANVDLGYSAGRFKDLYLSGGAYIGGTGSANYLSDYEEGSWTGTLTADTAPSSSQTATGSYTKIGRLVTVNIEFSAKNTSGASGALEVRGLPFSISDQGWGSYLSYGTANVQSSSVEAVAWANSGTKIIFYDWGDAGTWSQTLITAGADRYLFVSLTYATT